MGVADSYDPTMMLNDAMDKGNQKAPAIPGDRAAFGPQTQRFNGAQNFGTNFRDLSVPQKTESAAENGLSLPFGAQNFDPINLKATPRIERATPKGNDR